MLILFLLLELVVFVLFIICLLLDLIFGRLCKWCMGLDLYGLRLLFIGLVCVYLDRLIVLCFCLLIVLFLFLYWFDLLGNVVLCDFFFESNFFFFEFCYFIFLFWNYIFIWKFEEKIGIYCIFEVEVLIFLEWLL